MLRVVLLSSFFLILKLVFVHGNVDIWFGTAPFCEGSSSDCDVFGFKYMNSDKSGDGKSCWTGSKARCRVPFIKPDRDARPNSINVAFYNVYDRPFYISHDGQRERLCRVPTTMLQQSSKLDVIVFAEVFVGTCWPGITFPNLLRLHGFNYITKTVGSSGSNFGFHNPYIIKFMNGGVLIASRWPILHEAEHVYKATHIGEADQLSSKGVVYAKINKLNKIYHVLGTHLQAQAGSGRDAIREKQAVELHTFQEEQLRKSNDPNPRVIIAGDLNCDDIHNPDHTKRVLQKLEGVMPQKTKDSAPATLMPKENNVVEPQDFDEWLDYILYSTKTGHVRPSSSSITSVRLLNEKSFAYCASAPVQPVYILPRASTCRTTRTTRHLSDHYPVFATLNYD